MTIHNGGLRWKRIVGMACFVGLLTIAWGGLSAQETRTLAPSSNPSLEKLLPSENLLIFRVRDVSKLKETLKHSIFYQLWQDRAWAEVHSRVVGKLHEASAASKNEIGLSLKELSRLVSGEVVFSLIDVTRSTKRPSLGTVGDLSNPVPHFLLAWDASGQDKALQSLIQKTSAKNNLVKTSEDYQGVTVYTYKPGEGDPPEMEASYAQIQTSIFVLGSPKAVLEQAIQRWKQTGDANTLLSNPTYEQIQKKLGENSDGSVYVNGEALFHKAAPAISLIPNPALQGIATSVLTEVSYLKGVAFSWEITDHALQTNSYLYFPKGVGNLWKSFFVENAPVKIPDFIPSNADSFSITSVDLGTLWSFIHTQISAYFAAQTQKNINENNPMAGMMHMNPLSIIEASLGFDLQKDLFDTLGKEIIVYNQFGEASSSTPKPVRIGSTSAKTELETLGLNDKTLFAIRIKDKKTLKNTLDHLKDSIPGILMMFGNGHFSPDIQIKETTYLGNDCYTLPTNSTILCLTPEYLLFGRKSAVEDSLKLLGKSKGEDSVPILEHPQFKALWESIPKPVSTLSFQSSRAFEATLRNFLTILRFASRNASSGPRLVRGLGNIHIPDFHIPETYQPVAVSYTTQDGTGFLGHSQLILTRNK